MPRKPRRPAREDAPAPQESPAKRRFPASTMLSPVPAVLVTCTLPEGTPNIVTVAWTGTVCSEPAMLSISLRPERHSHGIVETTGEFAVNLPTARLARATDLCGVISGRDRDKFATAGLTAIPASRIGAPLIAECPVSLECRVTQTLALGTHTLFLANILAVHVDADLVDRKGRIALEKAGLLAYAHGHYYALGRQLGHFGFSVRKRRAARRR